MVRFLTALLVLGLCTWLVADSNGGEKKKKKRHGITGTVLSVEAAKDSKDEGALTIKTLPHKNKKTGVTIEGKEVKITINKDTKIEKAGKKKEPPTPAAFADLMADQLVTVWLREGEGKVAERVLIRHKKK
jgi:UDP-N-acetylglucosamine enolpyruvyl transferase